MKKIAFSLGVFFVSFLVFSSSFAAEFVAPAQDDPNVTVSASETHHNLYTAGGNVTVNSNVTGDLMVAGSMVSVDGSVEQDLAAAGGTLLLNSPIGGDARVAGGNVTINSTIAGDLLVAGGNVTISERASIGGDLVIAGGNVVVNAPVNGMARVGGGNVTLNSRIGGEVRATVSEKLTFGPNANIPSQVNYRAPREATFQQGSNVPNKQFNQLEQKRAGRGARAILTVAFLIKIVAWLIAAWLLMYFRGRNVKETVESIRKNPWSSLGIGAAGFVLFPLAIIVVFLTVIGYYVGFVLAATYLLLMVLVNLASALVLGSLVLHWLNKPGETQVNWQIVVLGVVLWLVLGFIPVVGWIVRAIVFLMVLGAALANIKHRVNAERTVQS